jgi:ubiquinone/menaquinone biosynthesis C-methylase UbiE
MSIYGYLFGRVDNMANVMEEAGPPTTTGRLIRWAFWYDLLVWTVSLGREGKFREKALDLAELKCGDSVLDIGCGTGTLAIAARRRVGGRGSVCGVDASPEMIARAKKKAKKAAVQIAFSNAPAEALPFSSGQFEVVLSTVMLHHLPRKIRQECFCEVRRVLKPGGRFLAIDFAGSAGHGTGFLMRLHRHGRINFLELITMLREAGLDCVRKGEVGVGGLHFVTATVPEAK